MIIRGLNLLVLLPDRLQWSSFLKVQNNLEEQNWGVYMYSSCLYEDLQRKQMILIFCNLYMFQVFGLQFYTLDSQLNCQLLHLLLPKVFEYFFQLYRI